ncbi:MAG TPA: nitrate reductase molybdenum cofactor assembly chaperone [Brevibacterium sp.]|nr:nitrate reductase molybdenum cofactor assembly chaperone [Brevibacterium sp.]
MFVPLAFLRKWKERALAAVSGQLETAVPLTDDQVRAAWLTASWLIGYPDDEVVERLDLIERLAGTLPGGVSDDLLGVVRRVRETDPETLRSEYVETFDTRRRGCLYLTYFTNGDTRKRGMALLDIKQTYREAGLEVSEDELPDHLAYVLEFGAAHDLRRGVSILLANRAGVELLRIHLNESGSSWAGVLRAVCATLPALDGDDIRAVDRLIAEGVEEEFVGLSGYGHEDGSADMPPADMSPYAIDPAGPPASAFTDPAPHGPAFIPLSDVKGPQT